MKVIRYVNGKKVQDLNSPDTETSAPATVPAPVKRVIRKVSASPAPQPAQPTKGCGCGR